MGQTRLAANTLTTPIRQSGGERTFNCVEPLVGTPPISDQMAISPSLCELGDAVSERAENESPLPQTPIGIRIASGRVRPLHSLSAMARTESSSSEQGLDEFHRIERH
jgi:hypothetical protein